MDSVIDIRVSMVLVGELKEDEDQIGHVAHLDNTHTDDKVLLHLFHITTSNLQARRNFQKKESTWHYRFIW